MSVFLDASPGISYYIGSGIGSGIYAYYGTALGLNIKL
jgi:hypothetical protein